MECDSGINSADLKENRFISQIDMIFLFTVFVMSRIKTTFWFALFHTQSPAVKATGAYN
jgi:hypothetical protein